MDSIWLTQITKIYELTESLFRSLAQDILVKGIRRRNGLFGKPFGKMTMREAIKKYRPETPTSGVRADNSTLRKRLLNRGHWHPR